MDRDNPFNPSFGNRPATIVGRDTLVRNVLSGLDSNIGSRRRCTLMRGQRGMGKTALLLEIADRASKRGFVVARVSAGTTMIDDLIDAVQFEGSERLSNNKHRITGVSAGAWEFSIGLSFTKEVESGFGFRAKMALLCDRLAKMHLGVLLLIDEVQPNSDHMRQLASAYQLLVGDGKNVAIVMAGLPSAVSSILNDDVLTFLNRASKETIGPLSISQIRAYYASTFKTLGISIPEVLVTQTADATRGFPYLLQLIGYCLIEYSEGTVTEKTSELACESAREDLAQNVFKATLRPLSDGDIAFLQAMAPEGGVSRIANIQQRLGGDKNRVQPYRARLINADVVASPRRGELEFTLPYLAEYLNGTLM